MIEKVFYRFFPPPSPFKITFYVILTEKIKFFSSFSERMSIVKKKQKENFFNLSNAPQNSSVSRKFTYSYSNFKIDTQKLRIRANPASHHWDLSRYGHWGFSDDYLRKMLPSLRIALWNDSLFVKVISFHYWFSFFLALLFFFIYRVKNL